MIRVFRSPVAVLLLALSGACSGAQQARPPRPFTPQLARFFDDSVDYVQDVEGLGGRVAADWQAQIDGLSRESDVIAVARIETVVLGTDIDGSRNYRLTAALSDVIKGEAPRDNHVALRVSQGQVGYNTVAGRETRLQSGRYIAFIRWYTDGAGELRAHWHLSPYSDSLLSRVRNNTGWVDPQHGRERIVRQEGSHRTR